MTATNPVSSQSEAYSTEIQQVCTASLAIVRRINREWEEKEREISSMIEEVKHRRPTPLKLSFFQKTFAFFSKDFKTSLLQAHNTAQDAQKKSQLDRLSAQQTAEEERMQARMHRLNKACSKGLKEFNSHQTKQVLVAASLRQELTEQERLQRNISDSEKSIAALERDLDKKRTALRALDQKKSEAIIAFKDGKDRLIRLKAAVCGCKEKLVKRDAPLAERVDALEKKSCKELDLEKKVIQEESRVNVLLSLYEQNLEVVQKKHAVIEEGVKSITAQCAVAHEQLEEMVSKRRAMVEVLHQARSDLDARQIEIQRLQSKQTSGGGDSVDFVKRELSQYRF